MKHDLLTTLRRLIVSLNNVDRVGRVIKRFLRTSHTHLNICRITRLETFVDFEKVGRKSKFRGVFRKAGRKSKFRRVFGSVVEK